MEALTVTTLSRTVEALRAEIEELRQAANFDKLTGLGNRRLLEERTEARGGFFVALDLNGFKRAQDAHPRGHAFGDEVLRRFARFLLAAAGEDRVACRVGGDEFVVWCAQLRGALALRDTIHRWEFSGVTASAGVGSTVEEADRRAYEAKEARCSDS